MEKPPAQGQGFKRFIKMGQGAPRLQAVASLQAVGRVAILAGAADGTHAGLDAVER